MLAGEGLHPSSKGARVRFSGDKRTVIDGPFTETKELDRRLLAVAGEVEGGGDRVGQALPEPDGRGVRDRDPPGVRGRGLRRRAHARARARPTQRLRDAGRAAQPVAAHRASPTSRSRDRGRLADRVRAADRRARADRARRRARRGPRAGRARRGARAVARVRRPGQPGRLADGHGQAPRDRPAAPQRACSSASTRSSAASCEIRQALADAGSADAALDDVGDDLLRLIFTTCHPVLSREARVALTLRLLGGLTTTRSRARSSSRRRRSRSGSCAPSGRSPRRAVPFEVPARRRAAPTRLASVLEVVYLVFNEGYSATAGDDWMRPRAVRGGAAARAHPRGARARTSPRCTGSSR